MSKQDSYIRSSYMDQFFVNADKLKSELEKIDLFDPNYYPPNEYHFGLKNTEFAFNAASREWWHRTMSGGEAYTFEQVIGEIDKAIAVQLMHHADLFL